MHLFPCYFVGSFPKPSYLKIPSWFDTEKKGFSAQKYSDYMRQHNSPKNQETLNRAFRSVIAEQVDLGGDIITDGEIDRYGNAHLFLAHALHRRVQSKTEKITFGISVASASTALTSIRCSTSWRGMAPPRW